MAELEDLKYRFYWKSRNARKLFEALLHSNMTGTKCDCRLCEMAGYWDGDSSEDSTSKECTFRPWMHEKMSECGLTASPPDVGQKQSRKFPHCSNEEGKVFDMPCHLVTPDGYYCEMTYGALIWKAPLGSDELEKLDSFFEILKPNAL